MSILYLQNKLGARFFVPKFLLPPKYDYHHPVDEMIDDEDPNRSRKYECVICMSDIDVTDNGSYMITPCNHIFHKECLTRWMEQRMQCAVCREILPSL